MGVFREQLLTEKIQPHSAFSVSPAEEPSPLVVESDQLDLSRLPNALYLHFKLPHRHDGVSYKLLEDEAACSLWPLSPCCLVVRVMDQLPTPEALQPRPVRPSLLDFRQLPPGGTALPFLNRDSSSSQETLWGVPPDKNKIPGLKHHWQPYCRLLCPT